MSRKPGILALIILLSLSLSGCFLAYRPTIEQGNILTDADMHAITRGMSQSQVVRRLGYPVLSNIYKDNSMVYIYTLEPNHKPLHGRSLIIYFRNGRVMSVEAQEIPPGEAMQAIKKKHKK